MLATLEQQPLGQMLVERALVTPDQLAKALVEQRRCENLKLLGEILVEQNVCSEEQVTESLAAAYGVPYARISPRVVDAKIISILPREFLEKHQILPLFLVEGTLTVAVPEPSNVFLLEEIQRLSKHPVQVVAATTKDIRATLQAYLPNDHMFVIDDLIDDGKGGEIELIEQRMLETSGADAAANDGPVVKLVNYFISSAVKEGASDIHIEPGENLLRIRFRVDGRLKEKMRPPAQMRAAVARRIKQMAGLDPAQPNLPQEGSIHLKIDSRSVDLRVSSVPGRYGENIVVRIIENEKAALRLEKLGFSYDTLKAWRRLLGRSSGILLVTGPGGSGKSTTLYATLAELNRDDANICTVEDPVERHQAGLNQFQVNEKAQFTYAAALRSVLRQDPDVIMLGELGDTETAKLAAQAALTGHLVLSTLHTQDAPGAISRLFNIGLEPYLVGATLGGVLSQRLVRKLCQSCREAYFPGMNDRRQLEKYGTAVETLFRAKGCAKCQNTGYAGRIGIFELLVPDEAMSERISQGATLGELKEMARKAGSNPLRADGVEKVRVGITTLDEVLRVTG